MSIKLHTLQSNFKRKKRKTIGRGNASGHGTYSTRGIKGQRARSGVGGLRLKGMKHIILSTPKLRGEKSIYPKAEIVSLSNLERVYKDGAAINVAALASSGLVSSSGAEVKILAGGKLSKKFIISGCRVSAGAKKMIEAAGGEVE